MRRVKYYVVDVFTDRPLAGNPVAIFPDRSDLREDELQRIAKELNLSETVFVEESNQQGALRRLRIFTPASEIPLAGHPVVGAWFLLASDNLVDIEGALSERLAEIETTDESIEKITFKHELGVGILPVTLYREGGDFTNVVMEQARPQFGEEILDIGLVGEALGIDKSAIKKTGLPCLPVSTGIRFLIVPVADRGSLANVSLNLTAFDELCTAADCIGVYAFTLDASENWALVRTRSFVPAAGVPEDPATGSAAGCLGAYLARQNVIEAEPTAAFRIEQGYEMGRPSRIGVEVTREAGEIARVRIVGSAVKVAEAEMILPD